MNRKNNTEKKRFKLELKRIGIYLLILVPVLIFVSAIFSIYNINSGLSIFLIVIIGIAFCVIFELIYFLFSKRKEKTILDKKDPYSD
jgi:lipopolysaccharide export LptBFGC system permease protein LptF